jgi:hypothetical protein
VAALDPLCKVHCLVPTLLFDGRRSFAEEMRERIWQSVPA